MRRESDCDDDEEDDDDDEEEEEALEEVRFRGVKVEGSALMAL